MRTVSPSLASCALILCFGVGCASISDSVTSPSRWVGDSSEASAQSSQASADSSNAASDSVSGSSSPDGESQAQRLYAEDVRLAARVWGSSAGSPDGFAREVGRIAERHGLTDWEGDPTTRTAVRTGLREAGLSEAEVEGRLQVLGLASAAASPASL